MKKIKIITVLWGNTYLTYFLDTVLPLLLSKNNIGSGSNLENISMEILTRANDYDRIVNNKYYKELEKRIPCEISTNLPIIGNKYYEKITKTFPGTELLPMIGSKFRVVNIAHQRLIKKSLKDGYDGFIVLYPDSILADGSLKTVINKAQNNKIVYTVVNMRMKEHVVKDLVPYVKKGYINTNDLFDVMKENVHPITESYMMPRFGNDNPCVIIWKVNESCWIAKSMHHYPIYINLDYIKNFKAPNHLDTYLLRQNLDKVSICVLTNSDDCLMIDIIPDNLPSSDIKTKQMKDPMHINQIYRILRVMYKDTSESYQPYEYTFKIHNGKDPNGYDDVMKKVKEFTDGFFKYIKYKVN